jgi:acyl carrier protein
MSPFETVQQQVTQVFTHKLNVEIPGDEADLIESGILDSLMFVSLLHELELEFKIQFSLSDIDMDRFRSIRRISELMLETR